MKRKASNPFRNGKTGKQADACPFRAVFAYGLLLIAFLLLSTAMGHAQHKLYGVISQPPNQGWLVEINPATGAATLIGNTGMSMPAGLTCDPAVGTIYASDGFGGGPIYTVNPSTGAATAVGAATGAIGCLAFRPADGYLYSVLPGVSTSVLYQISPSTGTIVGTVGVINKGSMGGLTARPSDSRLFGGGSTISGGIQEWLFTVTTTPGPPPRETDIGTTSQMITGLAFHPTTGTLYATNSSSLYTVNPSSGAMTLVGAHSSGGTTVGFVAGLAFAPAPATTGMDVWIKDCNADDGTVPSAPALCPQWWKSTDIWIDNNGDNIIDAPVVGANNILKAKIRNRGSVPANGVDVKFYYRDNSTGLIFPDGATLIGQTTATVGPGGTAFVQVPWNNLPAPPTTGGHWCIGVVLDHTGDPRITPTVIPPNDNNVGIANIWFIAGRAGQTVSLGFGAGTGGESGFGFSKWPREFKLTVTHTLPPGWNWRMEGIPADTPFTLKLGEERRTELFVEVAGTALPHTGGFVEIRQIDVESGRKVGGVQFNMYEDHLPPVRIAAARASVLDNTVLLSWVPVLLEAESGLRERVAYYRIIRNKKRIARAVIDADPHMPDFQWRDMNVSPGAVEYRVIAVDEGGNESDLSPAVTLTIPSPGDGGPFSGQCVLMIAILLFVILVLILLFIRGR